MVFEDKLFIARCIRNARIKSGYTQSEFAEKIDISAQQVSRIETASYVPSLQTFLKIVKALNLNLQDFGIDVVSKENTCRDEVMKMIFSANDSQIELYHDILKAVIKNQNK